MIGSVIDCLNTAYEADRAAIHSLLCNRVPCNDELGRHQFVIVDFLPGSECLTVGALGLLNGALAAAGMPRVAAKWENDSTKSAKLLGFQEYTPDADQECKGESFCKECGSGPLLFSARAMGTHLCHLCGHRKYAEHQSQAIADE